MITITLQKIRDRHPCPSGWEKLLKSKGGTDADYSAEFPLSDVLDSNGLDDTLWCLRCLPEHDNLWRKYAVWCARQVEHLMTDDLSKDALDVAWRHSEGQATDEELTDARYAAWAAERAAERVAAERVAAKRAAAKSAAVAGRVAAWVAAANAAEWVVRAAGDAALAARAEQDAARAAQEKKLRKILKAGEWR